MTMAGWLVAAIWYLWITGGLGWIESHEVKEDTKFTVAGKAIVMVFWPLMAGISAGWTLYEDLKELAAAVWDYVKEKKDDGTSGPS